MSNRKEDETTSPWKISKERSISMPLALLGAMLTLGAVGYAAWTSTKDQVQRNTYDIGEIKRNAQVSREILIRIDENVKDLRRERAGSRANP